MSNVAIVGYGNVGYHLSKILQHRYQIKVFGRSEDCIDINKLEPLNFEFIILTVPDAVIETVSNSIKKSSTIVLHTSGSRPLSDLSRHAFRGVIYPLQTFSKNQPLDYSVIPWFIEGSKGIEQPLLDFTKSISNKVKKMNSNERLKLHLSAVFACNFTNHLYHIADQLLKEIGLSITDIKHLALETLDKACEIDPLTAQTGPAKRNDTITIQSHLNLLQNENWRDIYQLISDGIHNSQK